MWNFLVGRSSFSFSSTFSRLSSTFPIPAAAASTTTTLSPLGLSKTWNPLSPFCGSCQLGTGNIKTSTPLFPSARLYGTFRTLVEAPVPVTSLLSTTGGEGGLKDGAFYTQTRGMKYRGLVRRRCRDCYLKWVNGMLYNLCKTHPRHKHGLQPAYYVNQRLLTHATQGPKRPW